MSEAPKKYTFLLYAPDLTDPEAFKRRLTVRQEHMANGKGLIDKGIIREFYGPWSTLSRGY